MDNTVRFNLKEKCAADSPPVRETGARASDLVELYEYTIPRDYKLKHFPIPPADRKWRCDFCDGLGASHEFSWHREIWKDDWDTEIYIAEYEEISPPIKVRCCRDKKCIREVRRLARGLLRERLRRISLPVPITGKGFWFLCPP